MDISSSPPIPTTSSSSNSSSNSKKRPHSDSFPPPPIPRIEELASHFYTRDGLHKHLMSLTPNTLSQMLLSTLSPHQFKPRPSIPAKPTKYAHCIYCHKAYDTWNNLSGCKVKHWGVLKSSNKYGGEREWSCCGGKVSYLDWDSDSHSDLADERPYCYTGKHWDKETDGGSQWAEGWEDSGKTCEDRGCLGASGKPMLVGRLGKKVRG